MSAPSYGTAFASQATFRTLMECLSRPGEIRTLDGIGGPPPMAPATAALVRSLADYESTLWLDPTFTAAPAIAEWIKFHTGAPIIESTGDAAFALVADPLALPPFTQFAQGSEEYPDRSTTVILQVDRFAGAPMVLKGPGIKATSTLAVEPLPGDFSQRMHGNREMFPRGIDLIFVAGRAISALPRSVRLIEER